MLHGKIWISPLSEEQKQKERERERARMRVI